MKNITIYISTLFFLTINTYASFPPKDVKNAIEEHCNGKVVAIEKDAIKNYDVFIVTCLEKNEKVEYFFSRDGRLIHQNSISEDDVDSDDLDSIEDIDFKDIPNTIAGKISSIVDPKKANFAKENTFIVKTDKNEILIFSNEGKVLDKYEESEYEDLEEEIESFKKLKSEKLPKRINNFLSKDGSEAKEIYEEILYFAETENDKFLTFYVFDEEGTLLEKKTERFDEEDFEQEEEENVDEEEESEFDTFEELSLNQLPKEIKDSIKKHVKGKNLEYGREIAYFVETEENEQTVLYIFNKDGELVERETEGEDEEFEDEEE